MNCSCEYEPAQFYWAKKRKARKDHTCSDCGGKIKKGETYRFSTGKWDGEVQSFKRCPDCLVIVCDLGKAIENCDCVLEGGLPDSLLDLAEQNSTKDVERVIEPIIGAYNAACKARGGTRTVKLYK